MRINTPVLCCTCATLVLSPLSSIFAGDRTATRSEARSNQRTTETYTSVESVAEHELARRQDKVTEAKDAIAAGDFAMKQRDYKTLIEEPEVHFRSGTSETKNWLVVAGMLAETGLDMELLDYVPCYRSEAGTGSGMAFATWQ